MENAYVQYLSFSLTFLFAGNEDEEADNEMRRFAVLSYIDLLEKPVLPDILVWIICWVSLITLVLHVAVLQLTIGYFQSQMTNVVNREGRVQESVSDRFTIGVRLVSFF